MKTYRNPIKRSGDFADPFVLRHDGRYYLYCTNPDVRCWSSTDLVNWSLEGPTIEEDEFPGLVPFAPEVVYSDGAFYMYTSPSGHGHYVLRSESPTGPFRTVSGNVGHAIDGNVFIDDDGQWYFYWAGDEGIWGCEMSSPIEFGTPVFTGIHMNGWTEGPFVSKRDGRYFMTLTGNHYLSRGYRIDAASSDHPLRGYEGDPLNPILISTQGNRVGLGHSSSVTGPDLVSTHMVYHNLNSDESRDLDIDRQVWNDSSLQVLGPTSSAPVPPQADAVVDWHADVDDWLVRIGSLELRDGSGHLDGSTAEAVWRGAALGAAFTAELNLTASASSYGLKLELGGTAALTLRVDRADHTLSVLRIDQEGEEILVSAELPRSFSHGALHCWRLEYHDGELRLLLDGRHQASVPAVLAMGSGIGVVASAGSVHIGHCAITYTTPTEADRRASKPVPGRFWAVHARELPDSTSSDNRFRSARISPGASLTYDLHVEHPGEYTVYLTGSFAAGDLLSVGVDGHEPVEVRLAAPTRVVSAQLRLSGSADSLQLRSIEGNPEVILVTIAPALQARPATVAMLEQSGVGKRLVEGIWDDFVLSATVSVQLDRPGSHGDLILRATQLSEGGEGDDTRLGINFFLGYSIQFHADRVALARHDYDERVLATWDGAIDLSSAHSVIVRAGGGALSLELDGAEIIRVDSDLPHLFGHIGVRTMDATLGIEQVLIEPGHS